MKLSGTPSDVLCVEIDTSDFPTPQVRVDVTAGGSETITISPLDPGDGWLSGQAYNQPCEAPYSFSADGGVTGASVTWVADQAMVSIVADQDTQAELAFHQLGGADVTVTFNTCDGGGGDFYYCGGEEAGPYPAPPIDAGPHSIDGSPYPDDAEPPQSNDGCPATECGSCLVGQVGIEGLDSNGCFVCSCGYLDAGFSTPAQ